MKRFRVSKNLLLVLLCCLLLAACGKEANEESKEDEEKGIGGISPAPTEVAGGGFSQKMDENGLLGEGLTLTGKAFGELEKVGEEDAVYCNLPENVADWSDVVPLCADPLYGILYYVDYGGDYMIHAIHNGKEETVVELPGRRLFCRGGKLYFLLDSYNRFQIQGAKSGNIAEYNPVTGEVLVLSEKQFASIVVYQDLIYGRQEGGVTEYGEEEGEISVLDTNFWFYFFDTDEWKEQVLAKEYYLSFQRCGDYFLAATLEESKEDPRFSLRVGMELRRWNGERGTVWDGFFPEMDCYVKNEKIHWLDKQGFHIWDIATGQDQVYLPDCGKGSSRYVLWNGQVFCPGRWLADLETGRYDNWSSTDEKLKKVHEFYTDGENLYAIAGPLQSEVDMNSVFRRVQTVKGVSRYDFELEETVVEVGLRFLPVGG